LGNKRLLALLVPAPCADAHAGKRARQSQDDEEVIRKIWDDGLVRKRKHVPENRRRGRAYVLGPDASNPQTCLVAEWAASSTYYVHRKDYP
jgi:hypothetical protein